MDINHWLEQWLITYQNSHDAQKTRKIFISFVTKNFVLQKILDRYTVFINIRQTYAFNFKKSYKDISISTDTTISNKALSLYTELYDLKI